MNEVIIFEVIANLDGQTITLQLRYDYIVKGDIDTKFYFNKVGTTVEKMNLQLVHLCAYVYAGPTLKAIIKS